MHPSDQILQNCDRSAASAVIRLLTTGGDDRIVPGADGRNRYFAGAEPFSGLAYGSSTISSIGADALAHLAQHSFALTDGTLDASGYAAAMDGLRDRLRTLYADDDTAICFAASGTDLEYAGLAAVPDAGAPICALLLGRDEVGSGCIFSAAGRFFAASTPVGAACEAGAPIDARHAANRLVDVPIRDAGGAPRGSAAVTEEIMMRADAALAAGEYPVVHVVHGSKTGLTLPSLADCALLAERYGNRARIIVDACQLRISPVMVRAYLAMGAVVLATGSKFVGGAPFSGFALVPPSVMASAAPLSPGFAQLARRAEWPEAWPGRALLSEGANAGLLLRLEGALFEMERFWALAPATRSSICGAFRRALTVSAARHGLGILRSGGGDALPCLASTLATLDLAAHDPSLDFDAATAIHRHLATSTPFRVGQPVRARRLPDGRFAATLRIALSMPMMVDLAGEPDAGAARLERELDKICAAIAAACSGQTGLRTAA